MPPQSPKKVGDDIAKATGDWKGLRITVKLTIQNRQAQVPHATGTAALAAPPAPALSRRPGRVDSALHPPEVDKMSATPPRRGGLPGSAWETTREPRQCLRLRSGLGAGWGGGWGWPGWSSPARERREGIRGINCPFCGTSDQEKKLTSSNAEMTHAHTPPRD